MDDDQLPSPPAQTIEVCYRHPNVQTRVHCTRCGRPICPDCMIPAPNVPVPECVETARKEFRQGPGRPFAAASARRRCCWSRSSCRSSSRSCEGARSRSSRVPATRCCSTWARCTRRPWPSASSGGCSRRCSCTRTSKYRLQRVRAVAVRPRGRGGVRPREHGRDLLRDGVLASAASYAFGPVQTLAVGASGAIFGIFRAFVAYNYRRRHLASRPRTCARPRCCCC